MGTIQTEIGDYHAIEKHFRDHPDDWFHVRNLMDAVPSLTDSNKVSNKLGYLHTIGALERRPTVDASFAGKYDYRLAESAKSSQTSLRRHHKARATSADYDALDTWMAQHTSVEKPLEVTTLVERCPYFDTPWQVYAYVDNRRKRGMVIRTAASGPSAKYAFYWNNQFVPAHKVMVESEAKPRPAPAPAPAPVSSAAMPLVVGKCSITVDAATGEVMLVVGGTTITIKNAG